MFIPPSRLFSAASSVFALFSALTCPSSSHCPAVRRVKKSVWGEGGLPATARTSSVCPEHRFTLNLKEHRERPSPAPNRNMATKKVQIDPISIILGSDCVAFHEDSESDLKGVALVRGGKTRGKGEGEGRIKRLARSAA